MPDFKKHTTNKKISFYLDEELYSTYKENKDRAKMLNLSIDYNKDFRKWFKEQLLIAKKELEMREDKKGAKNGNKNPENEANWKQYVQNK